MTSIPIPKHLTIEVLWADESIIVINKPCNLRSVPGHASPPPHGATAATSGVAVDPSTHHKRSSTTASLPGQTSASISPVSPRKRGRGDSDGLLSKQAEDADRVRAPSAADPAGISPNPLDDNDEMKPSESDSGPPAPLNRRTAQEAWILAIRSFASGREERSDVQGERDGGACSTGVDNQDGATSLFLQNLASTRNLASVPRKMKLFVRYANRNRTRLVVSGPAYSKEAECKQQQLATQSSVDGSKQLEEKSHPTKTGLQSIDDVAKSAFHRIRERQIPLLNLPEQTRDEDSALGQLKLMGYEDLRVTCSQSDLQSMQDSAQTSGDDSLKSEIRVVHRLDCETSGVMVFARNGNAASALCEAWRKRDGVSKLYLARVKSWPPFHDNNQSEGEINLPLAPSHERLKWEVRKGEGGKPSQTLWRLHGCGKFGGKQQKGSKGIENGRAPITLALTPITGRTHQLRVHCAAVGSGIEGDSLYGDEPIQWDPSRGRGGDAKSPTLRLHAHKLCFPHPSRGGLRMEFTSPPRW